MNSLNLTILLFRAQNYSLIMSVCGKIMAQMIPWGNLAYHLAFLTLPPILRDEIPVDDSQEGKILCAIKNDLKKDFGNVPKLFK